MVGGEEGRKRSLPISQEQRVWPMWSHAGHNNDQKKKKQLEFTEHSICQMLMEGRDLDALLFM